MTIQCQSNQNKTGHSQPIFSACSSIYSDEDPDSTMDYSSPDCSTEEFDTNLNDLNDYCLLDIFEHLPIDDVLSLRLVSKRFYILAGRQLGTIEQVMVRVNENHRGPFESCGKHRQTEFNGVNGVANMSRFISNFLIKLGRLQVLSLRFVTITEHDLVALSRLHCFNRSLEHLDISRCEFKNFYLSALVSYEKFFKRLGARLRHFVFFKNKNYLIPSTHLFKFIDQFLTGLETLVLDLKQFDNLYYASENLEHSSPIRHLSLHGHHHLIQPALDRFINRMIVGRHIEILSLSCIKVEPRSLIDIVASCPAVRVLKFSYDFGGDNRFGKGLIKSKEAFGVNYLSELLEGLQRDGTVVAQFDLAKNICTLQQLEELHLLEIVSANVNIDPLIFYLYHVYKRNGLRKLTIANYELTLLNLKALCFVSRQLEMLSVGEVHACCYKQHLFKLPARRPTMNESFAQTVKYLSDLRILGLNQCRFDDQTLAVLLENNLHIADFSFLRNEGLTANCFEMLAQHARYSSCRSITVRLDQQLVEQIENAHGPIVNVCPPNLNIVPC